MLISMLTELVTVICFNILDNIYFNMLYNTCYNTCVFGRGPSNTSPLLTDFSYKYIYSLNLCIPRTCARKSCAESTTQSAHLHYYISFLHVFETNRRERVNKSIKKILIL